jgi:hypothetical protein
LDAPPKTTTSATANLNEVPRGKISSQKKKQK